MDFEWTPTQAALRAQTVRFAREELRRPLEELDRTESFDRDAWNACGKAGILGLPVPKEHGGQGHDPLTTVGILESLGYGCRDNGLLFSINAHLWACEIPLLRFGTPEQKKRWLPGMADGSLIGSFGAAEPGAGSDAYSLRTTATRVGDAYRISGTKTWTTNAPEADLVLVMARLDTDPGPTGITGFLVPTDAPGVSITPIHKMGLRTSPMGEVHLHDVEVPQDARLGPEGGGMSIFTEAMAWERGFILATAVGTMQRQLEECLSYSKRRQQFGKPIGKFGMVSDKLVEMRLRLECARMLLYRVAWLKSQGKQVLMDAALAKLLISEAWVATSNDAIQIHGGLGTLTRTGVERDLRDAIGSKIYSGTSEIQRMIVAQFMGL